MYVYNYTNPLLLSHTNTHTHIHIYACRHMQTLLAVVKTRDTHVHGLIMSHVNYRFYSVTSS